MLQKEFLEKIERQLRAIYDSDESAAIVRVLQDTFSLKPEAAITSAVERLLQNEPLQYVLGEAWFYNLPFYVNKDVLIPRPETEELVHLILKDLSCLKIPAAILDIGTGSGCIPVAIKKNLPEVDIYAMDISPAALDIGKRNAERNGVEIQFFEGDILSSSLQCPRSGFQVIVSNPPYITENEKGEMHPNVLEYEPHQALFVTNGAPLQFYTVIAKFASVNLVRGGKLFVEINAAYGTDVQKTMKDNGFEEVLIIQDMQEKERFVSGVRI